jgi:hypothetical protein
MYLTLGFDPSGPGQWSLPNKIGADATRKARSLAGVATNELENQVALGRFGKASKHNGDGDAFRHAVWSINMTREIGPDAAKEIGDAHERSEVNPVGERLMDLFNNAVGRQLAMDPANAGRSATDIALQALAAGQLQTSEIQTTTRWDPGGSNGYSSHYP